MSYAAKLSTLGWPESRYPGPRIIGHRGACHHATENTLAAFEMASYLGADMWELDVRNSADGVCMVSHDDDLSTVFGIDARISELTLQQLQALEGASVPTLAEVVTLACRLGAGLYVEVKGDGAGPEALRLLQQADFSYAALGSFDPAFVAELADMDCPYPLSILVALGDDPIKQAERARADAIHLCWERASDRPDSLLTPELMTKARASGLPVILWHEERPEVIRAIMEMDVAAVCSDRPELLVPYASSPARPSPLPKGPEVVCHRGANKIAPENTLPAAIMAFEQGFDWLEIDVRETADGKLVVIHDESLERTTDGTGLVEDKTLSGVRALDAGNWFASRFAGTLIPTFDEILDLVIEWDKKLYVELKKVDPARVLEAVKAKGCLERCFFWSFDWSRVEAVKEQCPEATIMARSLDFVRIAEVVSVSGAAIIEINMLEYNIETKFEAARNAGARVMLCYSGEDREIMRRMIALQPDLVNLDHIALWKDVWNEQSSSILRDDVGS